MCQVFVSSYTVLRQLYKIGAFVYTRIQGYEAQVYSLSCGGVMLCYNVFAIRSLATFNGVLGM